MVITTNTQKDILREGGKKLAHVLAQVVDAVRPGVTTGELDSLAEKGIRDAGGIPSFKNYRTGGTKFPYPASLCVSVNNEVVHGIPGERVLEEGDIVGLDIGMQYGGIFTDMAVTVSVGNIDPQLKKMLAVTKRALEIGIAEAKPGNHIGDIGAAIQTYIESEHFGVVRELIGHGVGNAVHEDPEVPNWGTRGSGIELCENMVLALEPMVTLGSPKVKATKDGWVWVTRDGKPAAHFEHTILITNKGADIITR